MLVSLATDIEDPVTRLLTVSRNAYSAKERDRLIGPSLVPAIADIAGTPLLGPTLRAVTRSGIAAGRPLMNVVVSSFPGSSMPLYCAGSRLVAYHPFGPIVDGVGLNVTAVSYDNEISFGLLGDGDALGDIDLLAARFPDALTELVKELH
jgi:diacylglycerol O-acyltransferase